MAGKLLRSTVNDDHDHFLYIGREGAGITSEQDDHFHDVVTIFQTVTNPQTGEEQEVSETRVKRANGHKHEILDLEFETKVRKSKSDKELIKEAMKLFTDARESEVLSRKRGKESKDFVNGKQWRQEDITKLKADNRTILTINEIKPKRDILANSQRQSRTDIHYLPVDGGDTTVSEILNIVSDKVLSNNGYEYEETQEFEDQLDVGRGVFHGFIDRTKNLEGDIVVEKMQWPDVWFGPHNKLDGSDAEYCFIGKWFNLDEGEKVFGKKFLEVPVGLGLLDKQEDPHVNIAGDQWKIPKSAKNRRLVADTDIFNKAKKQFRIFELERKERSKVPVVFNALDEFYLNLGDITSKDLEQIETIPLLFKRDVVRVEVKVVTFGGNTILKKEISELGDMLSCIPAYGNKDGALWYGMVEQLKDMQREINTQHSHAVDAMKRSSFYVRYHDDQTFADETQEANYKRDGTKPGAQLKINDATRPPVKEEGSRFPQELVALQTLASQKMREVSNINSELMGLGDRAQSGIAILENKKQGLVGNEHYFDNLALSKRQVGRLLLRMIQVAMTPERIYRFLDNRHRGGQPELGPEGAPKFDEREVMELLNNTDLSQFDVTVDERLSSPTKRQYNFVIWGELARNGFPVPPQLLVELSDLPDKDRVIAMLNAQQQAEAEAEDKKSNVEIQKTLIAAQSKTQQGGGATQQVGQPAQAGPNI